MPDYDLGYMFNRLGQISDENNAAATLAAEQQHQFQIAQNAKAMAFSADQASLNREWQTIMSNTAHQREVRDLIAAGLNPILAANGGASTPLGSAASGVTSAGSMAQTDMSRNAAAASIFQSIMSADVAKENAQLNATTQMANAEISAKALTDSAYLQYAASKYATDNPNTYAGLARAIFSGLTGMGFGESAKFIADGLQSIAGSLGAKFGLFDDSSDDYHIKPDSSDDSSLLDVAKEIVDMTLHPDDYQKFPREGMPDHPYYYHKSVYPQSSQVR